ncbi:hypothetical protein F2P81_015241 [Scophthalmus maximus]|uniref:Uncharacterized protein n=1 Tax=Scophthalmus maximus TaxID=52904 RepID=A0A6A4SPD3_SCOMX|nr:hypothetical protein F2P81_015241 [Scophthalmus maximus]
MPLVTGGITSPDPTAAFCRLRVSLINISSAFGSCVDSVYSGRLLSCNTIVSQLHTGGDLLISPDDGPLGRVGWKTHPAVYSRVINEVIKIHPETVELSAENFHFTGGAVSLIKKGSKSKKGYRGGTSILTAALCGFGGEIGPFDTTADDMNNPTAAAALM